MSEKPFVIVRKLALFQKTVWLPLTVGFFKSDFVTLS